MKIYNTLTRKKEEFAPLEENKVRMYVCGPTVYNYFHIGNARPFIIFDVLRRYFIYKGYDVKYIQNFTDVDDKIISAANEEGLTPRQISEKYIEEYFKDARGLGIRDADVHPKVSENIPEIIDIIKRLIDKSHAYDVGGNVYFRVGSFPEYGKLSGQDINDLMSGARIEPSDEKESPLDFALWKKKKEGEIYWDSPWGQGRPGWHIECSAMSRKYLGDTIDIHGGGQDLIFPHHENETAQSVAANGRDFVRYWMHNGYINIDNQKMSKSLGNFFTIRDISEKYDLEAVRMFILSAHYKVPVNFSDEVLKQTQAGLERLYNTKNNLGFLLKNAKDAPVLHEEQEIIDRLSGLIKEFEEHMEDDLNTANALSSIFEMSRTINSAADENTSKAALEEYKRMYMIPTDVLGILTKKEELLSEDIETLIKQRQQARENKDFAKSDEIRDRLKELGVALEDTKEGVKWRRI